MKVHEVHPNIDSCALLVSAQLSMPTASRARCPACGRENAGARAVLSSGQTSARDTASGGVSDRLINEIKESLFRKAGGGALKFDLHFRAQEWHSATVDLIQEFEKILVL